MQKEQIVFYRTLKKNNNNSTNIINHMQLLWQKIVSSFLKKTHKKRIKNSKQS
jgi:hypothetical protein